MGPSMNRIQASHATPGFAMSRPTWNQPRGRLRSPAARAKTILARRTWNQGKESLWATARKVSASGGAIVNGSGLRPRMRRPPRLSTVRGNPQHSRGLEFSASIASNNTRLVSW